MDVENCPRVMYEGGRETELKPYQQEEEGYPQGVDQTPERGEQHVMGLEAEQLERIKTGHGPGGERRRGEGQIQVQASHEAIPSTRFGRHAERRRLESTAEEGEADDRQYPETPRRRRTHPDAPEFGGWDMIDNLTIQQCARMPMGLQTLEFIPNSMQDEWTKAWNDAQRMRDAAGTDEERGRALKWLLWLPQGRLHAPSRGGQKGARKFRDLARRFVMWRQKDMLGLIKVWKGAVVADEKRISKAKARKERGERSRIERAIRLLRHGAISRAGKALESMGLGDFEDPHV